MIIIISIIIKMNMIIFNTINAFIVVVVIV